VRRFGRNSASLEILRPYCRKFGHEVNMRLKAFWKNLKVVFTAHSLTSWGFKIFDEFVPAKKIYKNLHSRNFSRERAKPAQLSFVHENFSDLGELRLNWQKICLKHLKAKLKCAVSPISGEKKNYSCVCYKNNKEHKTSFSYITTLGGKRGSHSLVELPSHELHSVMALHH
jgi:hypothetical protein